MFLSLLRAFGICLPPPELDEFEPIYGLSKRSLDDWLSMNPQLKQIYELELALRLKQIHAARSSQACFCYWIEEFWGNFIPRIRDSIMDTRIPALTKNSWLNSAERRSGTCLD